MNDAAAKCAECPNCHTRYVFKQDSPWIGKRPARGGNEHRLFCLCGDVSLFDPTKLNRYLVRAEVYRRGYGAADEVPVFDPEGKRSPWLNWSHFVAERDRKMAEVLVTAIGAIRGILAARIQSGSKPASLAQPIHIFV